MLIIIVLFFDTVTKMLLTVHTCTFSVLSQSKSNCILLCMLHFLNRYARKHFPPANVDGTMTKEIQRAMALLAFKPGTSCSPYRVSYNSSPYFYIYSTWMSPCNVPFGACYM